LARRPAAAAAARRAVQKPALELVMVGRPAAVAATMAARSARLRRRRSRDRAMVHAERRRLGTDSTRRPRGRALPALHRPTAQALAHARQLRRDPGGPTAAGRVYADLRPAAWRLRRPGHAAGAGPGLPPGTSRSAAHGSAGSSGGGSAEIRMRGRLTGEKPSSAA
jgi:hypothetical protein